MDQSVQYRKPGVMTRKLMNPVVVLMMRAGISVWGSRILEVPGRTSGEPRRTPVNVLELDGSRFLVAPRGEGQWVKNVRANDGRLTLVLGRGRREVIAHELPDGEKSPVLRAYLAKWKMEVGVFFDGVTADSDDADVQRIAPNHPVFVLTDVAS
jgi:deazaflavin-dependent oxidoreductase (nitroreductase family)